MVANGVEELGSKLGIATEERLPSSFNTTKLVGSGLKLNVFGNQLDMEQVEVMPMQRQERQPSENAGERVNDSSLQVLQRVPATLAWIN